jgi:hypothetical protein
VVLQSLLEPVAGKLAWPVLRGLRRGNAPELPDECEFTALRYFALDGSDYPSHAAQETAIARYIRWANKHAQPKRHYAVNSKIRRPDYLPNVA